MNISRIFKGSRENSNDTKEAVYNSKINSRQNSQPKPELDPKKQDSASPTNKHGENQVVYHVLAGQSGQNTPEKWDQQLAHLKELEK